MADHEVLSPQVIKSIIQEINQEEEKTRRALAKRRHDVYKDGGKAFLIEQVEREFNKDAVNEMRLCPINILKKIVNKKASIYKQPPVRKCELESDQNLVDYYVSKLQFDAKMMKWHRYFHLLSNAVAYIVPDENFELTMNIVPSYLYSITPNPVNRTKIDIWCFNAFIEEGTILTRRDVGPATGNQGFSRDYGTQKGVVDSEEKDPSCTRDYIFWSNGMHMTSNSDAEIFVLPGEENSDQFVNPIEIAPVVNLAKDRDNEPWATQGEDMVDLAIQVQLGWSDVMTIAKHQAFSLLTVTSEEEPKKITIGLNRVVWLKQRQDGPQPSISYVQAQSPLSEYKDLLLDLVALLLSTNDMPVNSVGGRDSVKSVTSGFQALIEMSDTLEIIEQDKPILRDAEKQVWEIIKRWHNYLFDVGALSDEAKAFGKFSEDLEVSVNYPDIKPIESEQERLATVEKLLTLGLATKEDALQKLYPDLSIEQIQEKLTKIREEFRQQEVDLNLAVGETSQDGQGSVQV